MKGAISITNARSTQYKAECDHSIVESKSDAGPLDCENFPASCQDEACQVSSQTP